MKFAAWMMLAAAAVGTPSMVACAADAPGKPAAVAVGEKAPDFALKNLEGKEIKLADLRKDGPVVVIVLRGWVGKQCPICQRQVGQYIAAADKFAERRASVVIIYPGKPDNIEEKSKDFIKGKNLPANVHFVLDPDSAVTKQIGAKHPSDPGNPTALLVQPDGTVKLSKLGTVMKRLTAEDALAAIDAK